MADVTIRPLTAGTVAHDTAIAAAPAARVRKTADPAQKFEAFVLQSFIQEMMPETAESVYGSGISGDFWKSMMAEKVAEQVAARGSLGIANSIKAGNVPHVGPHGMTSANVINHLATMGGSAALSTDPKTGIGE